MCDPVSKETTCRQNCSKLQYHSFVTLLLSQSPKGTHTTDANHGIISSNGCSHDSIDSGKKRCCTLHLWYWNPKIKYTGLIENYFNCCWTSAYIALQNVTLLHLNMLKSRFLSTTDNWWMTGWRNVWSMKWRVPDQEADRRGLGERLCKKTVGHVHWTGRMPWR